MPYKNRLNYIKLLVSLHFIHLTSKNYKMVTI